MAGLGKGRARLWHREGLRMTKSSPCLKEPAVTVIGNRKQTSEVCGEIPLARPISEAARDRALLFLKGCRFVHWNKRLFFDLPQYSSDFFSCSIGWSCWSKPYAGIKLGSKQMGEQGLLWWEPPAAAFLLRVSAATAAVWERCALPKFLQHFVPH